MITAVKRSYGRRAAIGVALCGVFTVGWIASASAQSVPATPPPFDASSSADGFRVRFEVPNAPLSSRPLDLGVPTVQTRASSLGDSHGFAAAPDPGEVVQSAPGLAVGLFSQGAAGLPPIALPSPPTYPLLINSDISGPQHATVGQGPYELQADSTDGHSAAVGRTGLQLGLGTVASIEATSESGQTSDGNVLATATSDVQGLTVGPITLGQLTSTATMTMQADGSVKPSTDIHLSGLRIGGIDVAITDTGLQVASVPVPVAVGTTLQSLLQGAGLAMQFFGAQQFDNTVIAPTLVISRTVDAGIGTAPGTASLTIGGASATLTIPTPKQPAGVAAISSSAPTPNPTGVPIGSVASARTSGTATAPSAATTTEAQPVASNTSAGPITGLFDLRPTYLALAAGAAGVYALGQLLGLLGVKLRWTFVTG